ncbi:serine/threonine-protein kinase EDR1-like isoform X4 [Daucus carota subsp. sativus]|uniref:serine/threonine-protein kinase EDR1-like isoform X4 n=1 Tax=Daucus carota subsp. sativus TaxID=79200 RepID=UPI0007EF2A2D|nr:PREDICTED: serine/threonine-protein kinase EDR1-like isoform X3 [Daucus carota subsp. sativus]
MEDSRDEAGPSEQSHSSTNCWPADFIEKFGSASLNSRNNSSSDKQLISENVYDNYSSQTASQILWSTGMLSGPIPDGFYSVIHEKKLKDLFDYVPPLDELSALEHEGLWCDIIFVDSEKDKKLSKLKQLIVTLVKGLSSNSPAMIKKIAGLVSDVHKRPTGKAACEEISHACSSRGVQMLGQIKNGSCRSRAILFKVLADAVGLESRLIVGFPNQGAPECVDSYKHMSVIVVQNSVEFLVDLMRFPGQLIPQSTKAMFMTHVSATGESDSAENDSCDSPLEPNSPLYGVSDILDPDSADKDNRQQYQRRLEASLNVPGPSLRSMMLRSTSIDRNLSLSQSEPNIATTFWRRSRKKVIAETRTASSSPEHPSFRARGRSMLSGDPKSFREYSDDIATSSYRSEGTSTPGTRRLRRRSISITPEIGDDIVRAVRAMNETLKQDRLLRQQGNVSSPHSSAGKNSGDDLQKSVTDFHPDGRDELSAKNSSVHAFPKEYFSSQKAMSLPSSPHEYSSQASARRENDEMVSTWNKILESHMFQNKLLLPFSEWNIDFSEITVGSRVGIGFFGEVFRGTWNGTDVAIKVFLEQDLTAENMEDFCNEVTILGRLRHPNVILFLGACMKPPHLSMVTEYMEMGSLYYLIHLSGQKKILSWRRRLKMLRDICSVHCATFFTICEILPSTLSDHTKLRRDCEYI